MCTSSIGFHRISLTDIKRILRYLKGNTNPDLMYKKTSEYKLSGLYDATRDRIRRKCTFGNHLFQSRMSLSINIQQSEALVETSTGKRPDI
jgi:hypothetical protein